jgi:hypothetical protein
MIPMDFSENLPSFGLSVAINLFVIGRVRLNAYIPFTAINKRNPLLGIAERGRNLSNQSRSRTLTPVCI